MKRLLFIFAFLTMAIMATFGQNNNNKLSYQAVLRNSANELVVNSNITVDISIKNSETGAAVYSEQHAVTTNRNGLFSLLIGTGTNVTGSMDNVTWNTAYIESTITLPDNSVVSNTVPVTAVPYAFQADYATYADNINPAIVDGVTQAIHDTADAVRAEIPTTVAELSDAGDYVTNADLSNTLSNYPTNSELQNALDDYATDTELQNAVDGINNHLNDTLSHYPTNSDLQNALDGYTPLSDFENLNSRVNTFFTNICDSVKDCIESYEYVTREDLNDTLSHYPTNADLQNALDNITIPTVNEGVLTLTQGGNTLGTFSANSSTNETIDIPAPVAHEVRLMQGDNTLGTILTLDAEDKDIEIPGTALTAEDLNNFIDSVSLPTALSVYGHVQTMNPQIKEGLKRWVAEVVKNNPEYILDVLKSYLNAPNATTKEEVVTQYAIDHRDVAKAIMVDYLANGTVQEMTELMLAFRSNTDAFNAFKALLDTHIDSRIPAAATETSQKFAATAGQTAFTLDFTPKSNYLVRLYINGVMVGDSATDVVTVSGTTVTYVPAQNDNYSLTEGDKIIISYFK
ncbi:MAG: hypothetical protein K5890_04630 [Bacteroidales bacterium]|nr:hypothetical protein [Bacteroidales bacterium]